MVSVASGSNWTTSIVQFNPQNPNYGWQAPARLSGPGNGPSVSGRWMTNGQAIYFQSSDGVFRSIASTIPSGQDPDTVRNRAPLFLATEATNMQSSAVLTLGSGRVVNAPGETLAQQRIVGSNQIQPGQELVGTTVIATVPLPNMLADTPSITLHRVVDGVVPGAGQRFPGCQRHHRHRLWQLHLDHDGL